MAVTIQMHDLLESGSHFGHQRKNWNPKMKRFIFENRNGTNIIDLQQTVEKLREAYNFVFEHTAEGETILFVGTKKQAKETIKRFAEECGSPYINNRWLGGLLTNFRTVERSIAKLKKLEKERDEGVWQNITKKEALLKARALAKLEKTLGGIKNMSKLPDMIYIVDIITEDTAVAEALRKDIPIVAIVDTNADPDLIKYPIPANDDAIKSIKYITSVIADAVNEGKREFEGRNKSAGEEAETADGEAEDEITDETEEIEIPVSEEEIEELEEKLEE